MLKTSSSMNDGHNPNASLGNVMSNFRVTLFVCHQLIFTTCLLPIVGP
jgi:hypothetical protein